MSLANLHTNLIWAKRTEMTMTTMEIQERGEIDILIGGISQDSNLP